MAGGAANASGNAPAWFAGQQAAGELQGHQHGAVVLGHKSQELGSSKSGQDGANQLVLDDSAAGNRIELSSTTSATRLQLGSLPQQQDNQRLAPRGHRLELTTAAHGALRAGSGLLLSAHPKQPARVRSSSWTHSASTTRSRPAHSVVEEADAKELLDFLVEFEPELTMLGVSTTTNGDK